jgi:hypothetical protein
MGPLSLRVASYLPFTRTCYLNGHHFVSQQLPRQGVARSQQDNAILYQQDNAILAVAAPAALQAAAAALTPAVLQARCEPWAAQRAAQFSAAERTALDRRYRDSIAQVERATDVLFHQPSPRPAGFRRAVELGRLLGGADRTTQRFGRPITRRYPGKRQTVLDRRHAGQPVLRAYSRTAFVKQYEQAEALLRTETGLNAPYHLDGGRRLEHLPELVERMAQTNQRYLDAQPERLASPVDQGELARLAQPVCVGRRRVPGLRLEDDRLIRRLEGLLQPGPCVADWTSRDVLARRLARHRLTDADYRLRQLRDDLGKLRAHGLVERIGRTRRDRLTARGLKLGVLLVKLRTRLLGPLTTLATAPAPPSPTTTPSDLDQACRRVDAALDHLRDTLGLRAA